jgi:hypothetical protein
MAFSKMTKILKNKTALIISVSLLIVLTGVFIWLEIGDAEKTWENTPVKIKCNDQEISQPIASEQLIFWKNLLLTLGIAFSCFLEIALFSPDHIGIHISQNDSTTSVIKGRASVIPFWRWIACFLTGLVGVLLITRTDILGLFLSPLVAPNFLAVCQPHQLAELCKPDSQDWVEVTCTTPVQMWLPAVRSMLPKMNALVFYLIATSSARMSLKWRWMESTKMFCLGLFLQAINIALLVGIGILVIFYCNETQFPSIMFGYVFIILMAGYPTLIDEWLAIKNENNFPEEEDLPRYWNDVVPKNNIIPQVYLPTTLLTPCGNQNQSTMGPGLKPQKDNYTDTPAPSMSIYPKLPTE